MSFKIRIIVFIAFCTLIFGACAAHRAQEVVPTPIHQAREEIPEEQLLDVGILVFESEELTEEEAEEQGTNLEIRKAEGHFIPYHLKNTLHQSSHWGAIQVVPSESHSVDLMVRGKIHKSNGRNLMVEIDVVDATGKSWWNKWYVEEAFQSFYSGNKPGEKDAFQDLYDTIANDMAAFKGQLTPSEIENIRLVSKLQFAEDYAPYAFDGYLTKEGEDSLVINRLPADGDPMMDRLLKIGEREYMFLDVLNQYYGSLYNEMWDPYESWRRLNLTELKAMEKVKRDALTRQIIGALLVVGAVAAASSDSRVAANLSPVVAIIGGQIFIDGYNISKQAEIHAAAIEELSASFGGQMEPVIMEFEGKRYELTGTAEQQYKRLRELLREIYREETGFDQEGQSGAL
ncbi:MAG: hypothetical protein JRI47_00220 [Deltaproteobacteria bacterium]|nr:hypothetical protein [Deltaproteobacteria bacterium]